MARRMPGRLVALSASAVATIYVAGLLSTQPAAQSVAAAAAPIAAVVTPTSTLATSAPAVVVGASTSATTTPTTTTNAAYVDGTYSATGTSALGDVTVSLSVAGGKIANVQITKVTTKFPMSRIASLPAQVVQVQSANVNVISGATYSSQAFKQAVQQALTQAHTAVASATSATSATTVSQVA
jgi:uncharacterized protein with FMN-binding domain